MNKDGENPLSVFNSKDPFTNGRENINRRTAYAHKCAADIIKTLSETKIPPASPEEMLLSFAFYDYHTSSAPMRESILCGLSV